MQSLEILGYKQYHHINSARQRHSYNGRLIGNNVWHIKWHEYEWPWVRVKVTFVVMTHTTCRAVLLHQQSFLCWLEIQRRSQFAHFLVLWWSGWISRCSKTSEVLNFIHGLMVLLKYIACINVAHLKVGRGCQKDTNKPVLFQKKCIVTFYIITKL